ncbi:ALI_collapsed_G0005770.mRNA.1.CDS.1 [Saccharomyces cerevisiae]|nr:ALI_collapsed_G0005770.mRNA.1.CDS.1 [Saccharomyces cerevisiae]
MYHYTYIPSCGLSTYHHLICPLHGFERIRSEKYLWDNLNSKEGVISVMVMLLLGKRSSL